jgi:hypothetical protein
LGHPNVVALGIRMIDGKWKWARPTNLFSLAVLQLLREPDNGEDCMGISPNQLSAVTYPCTEAKQVMCEP